MSNKIRVALIILFFITLVYVFFYWITFQNVAAVDCENAKCHMTQALAVTNEFTRDINYWSNVLTISYIATIVFGSITAVMVGLQDDSTKKWSRPIALISTTLGAASGTIVSNFQPQEKIDKLIDYRAEYVSAANKMNSDSKTASDADKIVIIDLFEKKSNEIMDKRAKIKNSVGRISNMAPEVKSERVILPAERPK